jgi:hypothetical protein
MVGKTPVMVTDRGIVVADKGDPTAADKVRAALTQAGLSDVRLLPSLANASDNKQQISAQTGGLAVIHRDPKFGASNPQGFQGGGFAVGGAEVSVVGQRCDPACASPAGAGESPGLSFNPPAPADGQSEAAGSVPLASVAPAPAADDSAALGSTDPSGDLAEAGSGPVTFTRDVTPEVPATTASPAAPPQRPLVVERRAGTSARTPALRAALAAVSGMGLHDADEVQRMFLALAGAMIVVIVAARGLLRPSRARRGGQR